MICACLYIYIYTWCVCKDICQGYSAISTNRVICQQVGVSMWKNTNTWDYLLKSPGFSRHVLVKPMKKLSNAWWFVYPTWLCQNTIVVRWFTHWKMVVFHSFLYIYQRVSLLTVWVQPLNSPIVADLFLSLQRNAGFGIPTSIDFRHALRRAAPQFGIVNLVYTIWLFNRSPWKITISNR